MNSLRIIKRCYSSSTSKYVDSANVKVLADHSADWWNPQGVLKALHAMNNVRVPLISDGLIKNGLVKPQYQGTPSVLQGLNLLEVGCGAGILAEALAKLGANITGLEPANDLREIALVHKDNDKTIASKITYLGDSIENFSQKPDFKDKFDALILSEVIEHVNEPEEFLTHCLKPLKPGGWIFISTFNKTFRSWFVAILVLEYITRILPIHTHQWEKFLPPIEIQKMLEKNNCSVVSKTGLFYKPWNNTWTISNNDAISYALQAIKN